MPANPGTAQISSIASNPLAVSTIAYTLTRDSSAAASWPMLARSGPKLRTPCRAHTRRRDRLGGLPGRFDHRDDDRVGARVEHPADRCRIGGGQPYRGRDGNVLETAQQQGDVGVVEIAVLEVESDVVVAGEGKLLGPDDRRTDHPAAEDLRPWRRGLPAVDSASFDDRYLDAFGRRPAGQFERGLHLVDAERVGEIARSRLGMLAGKASAASSTRRRSSVTPDFRVRLLRSIVRMLIG